MFDPLPEHPPHMAGKFIMLFAMAGACASMAVAVAFGVDIGSSDAAFYLTTGIGLGFGTIVGWKVIMPSPPVTPTEDPHSPPVRANTRRHSSEQLLEVESRLNTSLWIAAFAVASALAWAAFVGDGVRWVGQMLVAFQLGSYVWFALSVGAAATALDEPRWRYVGWVRIAPFLALIPVPVVSTLIGVSPLSLKFLLGAQLERRIRERTFED
jgi:hypothetical protein